MPAQTVLRLARDYAATQPAMIVQNMSGAQRTEFGTYVAASQFYLALITGNIGKAGAGVCDAGGVRQMAKFSPIVPPAPNAAKIPAIPIPKIGDWVVNEKPHAIKFWWNMTLGAMIQLPNTNQSERPLKRYRLWW